MCPLNLGRELNSCLRSDSCLKNLNNETLVEVDCESYMKAKGRSFIGINLCFSISQGKKGESGFPRG